MIKELENFENFNEQIFEVYKRLNLKNLGQLSFDNENSASFLSNILRKKINLHPLPYSYFKIHGDMDFISKDLKYVIGVLSFLKPYIVNSEDGTYFQTLADRRYLMYANFGLQSIHAFWDRLGDLLHLYFETNVKADQVYFNRMIRDIKEPYRSTGEFIELNKLYEQHLKPIFTLRNDAIHHFQLECQHYWGSIENNNDSKILKELNDEKQGYPKLFLFHLDLCFKGFELVLRLIDRIPNKVIVVIKKKLTTDCHPETFFLKEIHILADDGRQTDLLNHFVGKRLDEEELKVEISKILNAPLELITLLIPKNTSKVSTKIC